MHTLQIEEGAIVTGTDEELVLAAGHVSYELTQMVDVTLLLPETTYPPVTNALLESVLLHARGLIEFVLNVGRDTDIRAKQFDAEWKLKPKSRRKSLSKLKKAIDQHLAHLTWARVHEGQRPWEYPNLVADVVEAVHDFTTSVERSQPHTVAPIRGALTKINMQLTQTQTLVFEVTTTSGAHSGAGTVVADFKDSLRQSRRSLPG
jgi:hypothetical protein